MTVVYYLHFCIFASSIYPRPPLLFAIFSARYQFGSATITNSLVNFIFALQVNSAFSFVRIRYISTISSASLSICFRPNCSVGFSNNQWKLLLEFNFGSKLKTALFISVTKLPAAEFSIHFHYFRVWCQHPNRLNLLSHYTISTCKLIHNHSSP